jgi:hypothetical protein
LLLGNSARRSGLVGARLGGDLLGAVGVLVGDHHPAARLGEPADQATAHVAGSDDSYGSSAHVVSSGWFVWWVRPERYEWELAGLYAGSRTIPRSG